MKNSEKGLSLIELMIAIGVMVAVVTSSLYVLMLSHQMSEEARGRLVALNAARAVLEEVKNTDLANVANIDTDNFLSEDLPEGAIDLSTNPSPIADNELVTVTVSVTWTGPKGLPMVLELSTMRSHFE